MPDRLGTVAMLDAAMRGRVGRDAVVAGSAKGRRLVAPGGGHPPDERPDVREAIFNSLHSLGAVEGATVLDLFAGSGALGIEALSRGARALHLRRAGAAAARRHPRQPRGHRPGRPGRRWWSADVLTCLRRRPAAPSTSAWPTRPTPSTAGPSCSARVDARVVVVESDRADRARRRPSMMSGAGATAVPWSHSDGDQRLARSPAHAAEHSAQLAENAVVRVLYPGSFDPLHNGHLEVDRGGVDACSTRSWSASWSNPQKDSVDVRHATSGWP